MTDDRSRRRFLRLAGASTVAGLAGCRSIDGEPPFPSGDRTPTAGGGGTDGGTTVGSTVPAITLGVMKTDFGADVVRSARIAADELNAASGGGGSVELVVEAGDGNGPGVEGKVYEKLMRHDVDATIGGLYPRGFLQSMAQNRKIHLTSVSPWPLPARLVSRSVTPINGNPEEEYETYKYFFRVGPLNLIDLQKAQVQLVKDYHDQLGWDRIGIVVENLNIGAGERLKALKDELSSVVDVPYAKVVSGSVNDWTPIYDKLEAADVDLAAVFLVISAVVATEQWADQKRRFEFGGIHLPAMEKGYWAESGGAADSVWTMNAATPQTSNTPQTQPFLDTYTRRHGGTPAYPGILTYDAVKIYAHAVAEVGSTSPEKLIPFFEDDMTFTGGAFMPEFGFRGPDAEFAHDPEWSDIQQSGVPVFQQWQPAESGDGGVMEAFAPKRNKTADYVQPPWMR